jgi:cation:H+ antiporter
VNAWLALLVGLVALYFGAQALVKGGVGLALRLGLTPLVIGLTVVSFGTSSAELVVSLQAAASGNGAISLGNVVGSNICNVALILGLCALVSPLRTAAQVIRREVPIMLGATLLALVMLADNHLARWEAAILLASLVVYTVMTVRHARAETAAQVNAEFAAGIGTAPARLGKSSVLVVGGLGLLLIGSHLFVQGAVTIAEAWGMSQVAIGLTIVALGTSLPELAAGLVAAAKREADVAIGNVVGSNIFNLLGILGVAGLIQPIDAPGLEWADLGVMVALSIAVVPVAWTGGRITRLEGAALLAVYVGYTGWLLARSL